MGDDNNRIFRSLTVVGYHILYLLSAARVKSRGRLVKYKHLRLHSHNARYCDTALLTARKVEGGFFEHFLLKSDK